MSGMSGMVVVELLIAKVSEKHKLRIPKGQAAGALRLFVSGAGLIHQSEPDKMINLHMRLMQRMRESR